MKKKAWTIVRNGYAVSIGVYFVIKQNNKFYCFSQDQMLLKINKSSCTVTFVTKYNYEYILLKSRRIKKNFKAFYLLLT